MIRQTEGCSLNIVAEITYNPRRASKKHERVVKAQ